MACYTRGRSGKPREHRGNLVHLVAADCARSCPVFLFIGRSEFSRSAAAAASHLIDRVVHSSGVGGEVPRHCAGTEQYLNRFFSEMGMHELTWLIRQPKSKDSGTEK
jgi:hypothetical protein